MKSSFDNSADDEGVETTAARWLLKRDEGFAPGQAEEFRRWRDADPQHAAAVTRLEAAERFLLKIPKLRTAPDLLEALEPASRAEITPARVFRLPVLRVAAGLVATLLIVWTVWSLRPAQEDFDQVYTTTTEGYERLVLPDGSMLELNANTDMRVRFTAAERRITLNRGEAHFSVTKNPSRPFVVYAGKVSVHAIGTAFNVRLGTNAVEIIVTEGKVRVSHASPSATLSAPASPNSELVAGQRATVSTTPVTEAPQVEKIEPAKVSETLAWQAPHLVFVEMPLGKVISQFNRRNRVQLAVGDTELSERPVGGTFRADNVEAFVRLLESTGEISADYSHDRIVLRKKR